MHEFVAVSIPDCEGKAETVFEGVPEGEGSGDISDF